MYLYVSVENGQPRELALCQLYHHTFVPYLVWNTLSTSNHIYIRLTVLCQGLLSELVPER